MMVHDIKAALEVSFCSFSANNWVLVKKCFSFGASENARLVHRKDVREKTKEFYLTTKVERVWRAD